MPEQSNTWISEQNTEAVEVPDMNKFIAFRVKDKDIGTYYLEGSVQYSIVHALRVLTCARCLTLLCYDYVPMCAVASWKWCWKRAISSWVHGMTSKVSHVHHSRSQHVACLHPHTLSSLILCVYHDQPCSLMTRSSCCKAVTAPTSLIPHLSFRSLTTSVSHTVMSGRSPSRIPLMSLFPRPTDC